MTSIHGRRPSILKRRARLHGVDRRLYDWAMRCSLWEQRTFFGRGGMIPEIGLTLPHWQHRYRWSGEGWHACAPTPSPTSMGWNKLGWKAFDATPSLP